MTITATSVADSSRSGSVEVTVAEDSEQKPSGGDGDNNGEQTGKPDGNTGGQTSDSDAGADSGNNQKHMPLTGAAVAAVAGVAVLLAGAGLLLKRLRRLQILAGAVFSQSACARQLPSRGAVVFCSVLCGSVGPSAITSAEQWFDSHISCT